MILILRSQYQWIYLPNLLSPNESAIDWGPATGTATLQAFISDIGATAAAFSILDFWVWFLLSLHYDDFQFLINYKRDRFMYMNCNFWAFLRIL